ncbi:MAG: hypothetical protein NE328_00245, partial [Lentisphaeraceae bacterium]|nr:hypothetical protein [Lentisphaeraceae bacterium]
LMFIKADELNLAGCPAPHPELLLNILPKFKKMTLPSKWKKHFETLPDNQTITWSDLPAPIVQ